MRIARVACLAINLFVMANTAIRNFAQRCLKLKLMKRVTSASANRPQRLRIATEVTSRLIVSNVTAGHTQR